MARRAASQSPIPIGRPTGLAARKASTAAWIASAPAAAGGAASGAAASGLASGAVGAASDALGGESVATDGGAAAGGAASAAFGPGAGAAAGAGEASAASGGRSIPRPGGGLRSRRETESLGVSGLGNAPVGVMSMEDDEDRSSGVTPGRSASSAEPARGAEATASAARATPSAALRAEKRGTLTLMSNCAPSRLLTKPRRGPACPDRRRSSGGFA
jgi:hypothetical protein